MKNYIKRATVNTRSYIYTNGYERAGKRTCRRIQR